LLTGCGGGDAPEAAATTEPTVADAQAEPTTVSVAPTTADDVGNHDSIVALDFQSGTSNGTAGSDFQLCPVGEFTGLATDGTPACISRQEAIDYMSTGNLPAGFTPIDPQDDTSTNILFSTQIGIDVSNGKSLGNFKIGTHYDALGPNVIENLFFVEYTENGEEKLFVERAGAVYNNSGFLRYRAGSTVVSIANYSNSEYEVLNQLSGDQGDEIFNQGQTDERVYSRLKAPVDIDGNFYRQPGQAPGGIELGTIDENFLYEGTGDNPYIDQDGLIWFNVDYVVGDAYSEFDPPPDRLELDKRVQNTDVLGADYSFDDFEEEITGVEDTDTIKYSIFLREEDFGTTAKNLVLSDDGGVIAGSTLTNTVVAEYERTGLSNGSYIDRPYSQTDTTRAGLDSGDQVPQYIPGSTRVYDKDYNPVSLPQLGGSNVIPDVTINGEVVSALMDPDGYLYNLDPFNPQANYLQGCWRFIRYIEYEVEFVPQAEPDINSEE
jgi:hypothetical protein